jgi:SAM-dependent methyltransferase
MPGRHPVLNDADRQRVVHRYQERIARCGVTFDSLNSGSPEKQRIRHAVHATALRGDCPAVLDVGCGLGGFYEFLRQQGIACRYTGYDIVPEYVAACQQAFPESQFLLRNIFEDGIDGTFDSIVMSQVFNNRYRDSNNIEVVQHAIRLAFEHARTSVSVDMLSTYVDYRNPEVFYYGPEDMFRFARTVTPRVCLRHDYRLHEFCLQLFHVEAGGFVP